MLFSSYEFIFLFLPLVVLLYYYLSNKYSDTAARWWLVISSLFYYSRTKFDFLLLFLASLIVNYLIIILIERVDKSKPFSKKVLVVLGVSANVCFLSYYKYANFFIDNVNFIFATHYDFTKILLPPAISFFTFQQIAFLVDFARGETERVHFLDYTLYMSFFPKFIAGPIVRHYEFFPQLANASLSKVQFDNIAQGLFLFCVGLFKKVCLADFLANTVAQGFDSTTPLPFFQAWWVALAYTFQIFLDFSGYVDMATGAALLFNIRLPNNFMSPYLATDIQDFWRRWHITLSRFLRDYVYIPLGGSRHGLNRTLLNTFLTFLVAGIWHGAGWTFIIWGALHGIGLMIQRLWRLFGFALPKFVGWLLTFVFVLCAWVFFRAKSLGAAWKILAGMAGFNGVSLPADFHRFFGWLASAGVTFTHDGPLVVHVETVIFWLLVLVFSFRFNIPELQRRFRPNVFVMVGMMISLFLSVLNMYNSTEFLYFNF